MKYKLKDLGSFKNGANFPKGSYGKGVKIINVKDLFPSHYIDYSELSELKEDVLKKQDQYLVQHGDILFTRSSLVQSGTGMCAMVEHPTEDVVFCGFIIRFRPNLKIVNPYYLVYLLRSQKYRQMFIQFAAQTTITNINQKSLGEIEVELPDMEQQIKTVGVLKLFDDKIRINKLINDNLLRQIRACFKSWFVDFEPFDEPLVETPTGFVAPRSLKMAQIQDIPHVLETGKRPKGGAVSEGVPSIGAESVKNLGEFDESSAKYIPVDFASSMKKGKIDGYELLLYKDGGKPGTFIPHFSMFGEGFPYEEFYINEHVFKLDFYDRGFNEFAYLYMQTDYPYHWLASNGVKAAIPGINQQDVNSIWIYLPDHPKVQEFCKWVQPFFVSFFTNSSQNMKLARIRDTLLLKLMFSESEMFSA